MPIRLIVTDIDGTLLNRQGEVTPRVRAALAELERRGGFSSTTRWPGLRRSRSTES